MGRVHGLSLLQLMKLLNFYRGNGLDCYLTESQFLSNIINQHIVNGCVDEYNYSYEIDESCFDLIIHLSTDLEFSNKFRRESLQFIVNENSISVVGQQNTVEIIVSDLIIMELFTLLML